MSITIYGFADEASPVLEGQIRAMKRNGLQGVELRNVDHGVSCVDLSLARAKEIRRDLEEQGLQVFSMGSPIGKIRLDDDFEGHLTRFRHGLDVAQALGCSKMRMFSFYIPVGTSPAPYRQQVMDQLARLVEASKGSGVTLCHENEKGIYGDTAERCREILDAFPQMACIFDPANYVQCGQDTWKAWQMLQDRVRYLHIKDALSNGQVVPAGKGEGQVQKIVADYIQHGGSDFSMEPHLSVFDGLKQLEQSGQISEVGQLYAYASPDTAFDAACEAFKNLLREV